MSSQPEPLDVDTIEARAITAPPWRAQYYECGNDEERESLVERFREHLQSGGDVFYAVEADATPQHEFYAEQGYDLARGVTIAFTGNGPSSAENALFIAAAPANVLALVAEVRRLREREAKLRALHAPVPIYQECGHEHEEAEPGKVFVSTIGLTCNYRYDVCRACCISPSAQYEDEPFREICEEHRHRPGTPTPICKTREILDA